MPRWTKARPEGTENIVPTVSTEFVLGQIKPSRAKGTQHRNLENLKIVDSCALECRASREVSAYRQLPYDKTARFSYSHISLARIRCCVLRFLLPPLFGYLRLSLSWINS